MASPLESRLSRRDWLRAAQAAAVGTGLAGLLGERAVASGGSANLAARGASAVSAAQGEPQAIRLYSLAWQPDCVKAMQAAAESWNAANGTRVTIEYVPGAWDTARDFLTTSLAGGVAPDVIHGITPWTMEYGLQGAYADLTDRLNASSLAPALDPIALDAARSPITDGIYGVPFCWEVGMMFLNADRFAEQGIAIPEQGWTWEEFVTTAVKLNAPPDYYALAASLGSTEDLLPWLWQTGAEVLGDIDGQWQMDVERARPALVLWHDMLHKEQVVSPNSFGAFDLDSFSIGAYTMFQTGCYARGTIIEAQPSFTWRMVPLPHQERNASGSQPQTWSIAAATEEQGRGDAAWEVIEWFTNDENMTAIAKGDWLFPTRISALSDPAFSSTEDDWNLALNQLQYAHAYPRHPAWPEIDERVLAPNIQRYLQDQMALDDLIALITEAGNQIVAEY